MRKQTKIQSAGACQLQSYLFMFLFWELGFGKEKNNSKHCKRKECDFKYELCSHPANRLWREKWCHHNSRLATQAPFPRPNFSEGRVHVTWFDGSSQQVFHIAHLTRFHAHSDQSSSPKWSSVLNSRLLKVMHGLKCCKGVWLKCVCPHQENLSMVSCIGNWWYLGHTLMFRSDCTLEAGMKSQLPK